MHAHKDTVNIDTWPVPTLSKTLMVRMHALGDRDKEIDLNLRMEING